MRNKSDRAELLAPAGSPQAFYAAVRAGADAVYLGGSKFGARAYAENFTQDQLLTCIKYGRMFGVKVYLTVNTLLKEEELKELPDYLAPYYQAGLDAVIVQDMGVLNVIRECFPGLEIHASTQMTLCSPYGAQLLKDMGASRIVPARELSLSELIHIKEQVDVELETFIHGAMCYCYSGQCLFSSILGGRSGNRGRCAQPCRLPYSVGIEGVSQGEAFYPLSLKDMCTIGHLPALIEAGIDSFKIEGRMKKPEYAAGVTAIYRKYMDLYYELREKRGAKEAAGAFRVEREDVRRLSALYIRSQVHDGYYFKRNGREMVTLENPAYSPTDEVLLEEIRKDYMEEISRLDVEVEAEFWTGRPARVILRRGENFGEAVGGTVQAALKQPITEEDLKRQLGRLGDTFFRAGQMHLRLSGDAFYPLKQINELRRQAAEGLEKSLMERKENRPDRSTDKNAFSPDRPEWSTIFEDPIRSNVDRLGEEKGWAVSVRTYEQLQELVLFYGQSDGAALRRVYMDGALIMDGQKEIGSLCRRLRERGTCEIMAAMPYILRQADEKYLERLYTLSKEKGLDGLLIRSADGLGFLKGREKIGHYRADAGFYIWNSRAAMLLSRELDGFCIPYELNAHEQRELLATPFSWEKIVYGRIPMMISANCVLKTAGKCMKGCRNGSGMDSGSMEGSGRNVNAMDGVKHDSGMQGCRNGSATEGGRNASAMECGDKNGNIVNGSHEKVWLTDRYKKNFPVLPNCRSCTNIIYNSVPLSLHGTVGRREQACDFRLDFTLESAGETADILRLFWQGGSFSGEYTTGHEKRGVM